MIEITKADLKEMSVERKDQLLMEFQENRIKQVALLDMQTDIIRLKNETSKRSDYMLELMEKNAQATVDLAFLHIVLLPWWKRVFGYFIKKAFKNAGLPQVKTITDDMKISKNTEAPHAQAG